MLPGLLLPEVPVFASLNPPVEIAGTAWPLTARPLMQPAHFNLLMAMLAGGAALGMLVFRIRRRGTGVSDPAVPPPPA